MKYSYSDVIIALHDLARSESDSELSIKLRFVADEVARIGNESYERSIESLKIESDS